MDPTALLLRWAHILAAIVALGGLIFARFAVLPTVEEMGKETADKIHAGLRRRWLPWVMGAITLLLASGLTNYILMIQRVKEAPELWGGNWMRQTGYHSLFGAKFLLAMIVFYLASGLVGRGAGTQWIRDRRKLWLSVTVGLGVAVVLISGWLRTLHTGANDMPDPVRIFAKTYLNDIEAANASDGRDEDAPAQPNRRPAEGRPEPDPVTPPADPAAGSEEKPDGQETEEADGGAPSEGREAPAARSGSEEAA
jgi:uncharacterized membrane protein